MFKLEMAAVGILLVLASGARAGEDAVAEGRTVYARYCVSCHGPRGDGDGYAARSLDPLPRNLMKGVYKWRSTPSGEIPRDEDLLRTIANGVYGTAMPTWYALSAGDRRAVLSYIKTFSPRFATETPSQPLVIPPQPAMTKDTIAAGRQTYERMKCAQCHGEEGCGDGPAATTLKDDSGRSIRAYNLTTGSLKSGNQPEDIYRVFMTGLNGTPMPSFAEILKPEEAWQLVHYILSLRGAR